MPYAGLMNPVGMGPAAPAPQLQGYAPMNPVQGVPQEGPPTTPQELEQRKSGWQDFMTKLQTDPAMRQSALMTATTLMRGAGMGENAGNLLGRSLQAGVISHGFHKANQTRMDLERQKFEQERALNQAQIAQQQAQTRGLDQTHGFAREDRPTVISANRQALRKGDQDYEKGTVGLEADRLGVKASQFQVDNQADILKDSLLTSATDRRVKGQQGEMYDRRNRDLQYDDNGNPIPGSGKEPLSAKDIHIQKTIKRANPRMEGESEADYDVRLAQLELGNPEKSMDSVVVQASQKVLEVADPGTPEYNDAVAALTGVIKRNGRGVKQDGAAPSNPAAWQKARNAVAVGQTYTGPDGKTYVRGQ